MLENFDLAPSRSLLPPKDEVIVEYKKEKKDATSLELTQLDDQPPEIINKIIDYCAGDEQSYGNCVWTLKALRLVSHRYCAIVDDFLERKFVSNENKTLVNANKWGYDELYPSWFRGRVMRIYNFANCRCGCIKIDSRINCWSGWNHVYSVTPVDILPIMNLYKHNTIHFHTVEIGDGHPMCPIPQDRKVCIKFLKITGGWCDLKFLRNENVCVEHLYLKGNGWRKVKSCAAIAI